MLLKTLNLIILAPDSGAGNAWRDNILAGRYWGWGSQQCHFLTGEKREGEDWDRKQIAVELCLPCGEENHCERAELQAEPLHCSGLGPGRIIQELEQPRVWILIPPSSPGAALFQHGINLSHMSHWHGNICLKWAFALVKPRQPSLQNAAWISALRAVSGTYPPLTVTFWKGTIKFISHFSWFAAQRAPGEVCRWNFPVKTSDKCIF